jgi:AcrR family transcriptional regulator
MPVTTIGEEMKMSFEALLKLVTERAQRDSARKQDRSRRTEQQILNGAIRVFARDGISRSRIADIAAEAGISTSTLYEYYASKEDLAYDVPLDRLAMFYGDFAQEIEGKASASERLYIYLSMLADFARQHAEWARLFYLEIWPSVFVSETQLRQNIDDFARIVVQLVRDGMDEGDWSGDHDPYQTAAILLGGINQVITTWLLYRQPPNLTKAGADMASRTIEMLRTEFGSGSAVQTSHSSSKGRTEATMPLA